MNRKENWLEKKMNRASGTCETVIEDLAFVSSESQKERRTSVGLKKYLKKLADNFPNLTKIINLQVSRS